MSYQDGELSDEWRHETAQDRVGHHFRNLARSNYPWPAGMPRNADQAISWWIEFLEPQKRDEKPRRIKGSGDSYRWEYPYHTRLHNCLHAYWSSDKETQEFILAAKEDGVHWRGEPIWHFRKIYDETMKYHALTPDQKKRYARAAFKHMRKLCSGVQCG